MEVGSQSITNSVISSDVSGAKKTYKSVTEYLKLHNVKTKDGSKKIRRILASAISKEIYTAAPIIFPISTSLWNCITTM